MACASRIIKNSQDAPSSLDIGSEVVIAACSDGLGVFGLGEKSQSAEPDSTQVETRFESGSSYIKAARLYCLPSSIPGSSRAANHQRVQ